MTPQKKLNLQTIRQAVHTVLCPIQFCNQKLTWRRETEDLLQQISIVSLQLQGKFQPHWGLNIFVFDDNPKPITHRLQVQWFFADALHTESEREKVYGAFDISNPLPDLHRKLLVSEFIRQHVVPCFELFKTRDNVQAMMHTYSSPFRARQFINLPDDWWPED